MKIWEGGQNYNFHLRCEAKLQEVENDLRKMAASCYFSPEIGKFHSELCWF